MEPSLKSIKSFPSPSKLPPRLAKPLPNFPRLELFRFASLLASIMWAVVWDGATLRISCPPLTA